MRTPFFEVMVLSPVSTITPVVGVSTVCIKLVPMNDPVPLFPYPGSPDYRKLWGPPDDRAWERAHEHYLAQWERFSDIQDDLPLPLQELEDRCFQTGCPT